MLPKFNPRTIILLLFIFIAGAIRTLANFETELSPLTNFSPLGAMALFGGAYFSKPSKAFGFPLLTLFISDLVLSFTVFSHYRTGLLYSGWYWTYGAFALMTLAGQLLLKKITAGTVLLSSLVCVLIHWIVTDFGVWLNGSLYPKTFSGFAECLIAALPFERNFLTGTLLYSIILFGLFEWMQSRYTALKGVN